MIVTLLSQFYQPTLGGLRIKGYFRGEDSTLAFFSLSVTSIPAAGQLCRIHFHDTFKTVHLHPKTKGVRQHACIIYPAVCFQPQHLTYFYRNPFLRTSSIWYFSAVVSMLELRNK